MTKVASPLPTSGLEWRSGGAIFFWMACAKPSFFQACRDSAAPWACGRAQRGQSDTLKIEKRIQTQRQVEDRLMYKRKWRNMSLCGFPGMRRLECSHRPGIRALRERKQDGCGEKERQVDDGERIKHAPRPDNQGGDQANRQWRSRKR